LTFETKCIRCGQNRILLKAWTDRISGKGPLTRHELYVCPNKECQKIVDEKFEEMRRRRVELEDRKKSINLKPTGSQPKKF